MNYKLLIFFFAIILSGCVVQTEKKQLEIESSKSFFITKGFTLVYDDQLYTEKLIGRKIEERSLIIFQKNLKKNTDVKITNLNKSKYIIVKVGKKTNYPIFFNSVISQRISKSSPRSILSTTTEIYDYLRLLFAKVGKLYCYQCNSRFETKVLYDYHRYKCDQTALRGGL